MFGHVVATGVLTATSFVVGDINSSGVVTATSFSGDGSNLTGVSGFATALNSSQSSPLLMSSRHQGDWMSVQEHQ